MIDLRSDTVTKPVEGMRRAMAAAEVGDDGFGDDPTVNALQERMAGLLGKEGALYVPSGTMGNEVSLKVMSRPGTEAIVEEGSHIFNHEVAAAACISGLQLRPVRGVGGILSRDLVAANMRPGRLPFPRTSVICVENTHNRSGGRVHPLDSLREIGRLAGEYGVRFHLDGARLFNAQEATGTPVSDYAACADAVTGCFSIGCGAPGGSGLAGPRGVIEVGRRARGMLGGGMRQVGVLASACLYALEHHVERLREDHENAALLAGLLEEMVPGIELETRPPETNIVSIKLGWPDEKVADFLDELGRKGVLLVPFGPGRIRAVTHIGIDREDVTRAAEVIRAATRSRGRS